MPFIPVFRSCLFLTVFPLLTAGCTAASSPVIGSIDNGKSSFTGRIYDPIIGDGSIELTMADGSKCNGRYKQVTLRDGSSGGEGNFTCDDGWAGKFTYTGPSFDGTGTGTLSSGKTFTIKFGPKPAS